MAGESQTRVLRVISRLVGGSSIQAITLTRSLEPLGYDTTLVAGEAADDEGTMRHLADELAVQPVVLPGLRRSLGPHDMRAIAAMRALLRRERPQILHTHAAKGGTVGRTAAQLAGVARPPVVVHTFHGHVLRGYFGPRRASLYARVERWLARRTTAIVAVAPEVKRDLVELGVAPPGKIEVVPLGFELEPFAPSPEERQRIRDETRARLGLDPDARVVTLVARLVPIKRVDRFLRIMGAVAERHPDVSFLVVGDGELERDLIGSDPARRLGGRLVWAGFERDMPAICFASDVAVLTSDNEGTPVSLIEAHAAGLPAVTTDVGGVRQVVEDGQSGFVVKKEDEAGFAEATATLTADPNRAADMGERGRRRVTARYGLDRLSGDIDALYRDLLRHKGLATASQSRPPRPAHAG